MTLPSENAAFGGVKGTGGSLWNDSRRSGSVLPLEFKAIDHPLRRKTDWMVGNDQEVEAPDNHLREELANLEARFNAQAQQLTAQMEEHRMTVRLAARLEWEAELEARITAERLRVATTCTEFAKARASYFLSVEEEVVRLALGIAARVLHREAKLDPLLLEAVVRVALEKIAEESGAVLHVPLAEVDAWSLMFAEDSQSSVTVVGEERMAATECVLQTSLGRVELGVVAQLEEIEKGFFDLLQQRPT